MKNLKIENLHVRIGNELILKGINLEIQPGKVHALMGPNGAGKSCLANTLMGNPKYIVEKGKIFLDGEEITKLAPDERAKKGLFLSFQYPLEITGVTMSNFLRTAYNSLKGQKTDVASFHKLLKEKMTLLGMDSSFSKRYINEGFSGGEKKRAEILQLSVLQPKYAILDESDSGTDIDALKNIADGINAMKEETKMGFLLITHYNRILNYVKAEKVSVLIDGKIVKESEGSMLADEIEAKGYKSHLS